MTSISVLKNHKGIIGFRLEGHAGYSIQGRDIVCAALSAITITTINALQEIAHKKLDIYDSEGYIEFALVSNPTVQSNIILKTALEGYKGITEQYSKYVKLDNR